MLEYGEILYSQSLKGYFNRTTQGLRIWKSDGGKKMQHEKYICTPYIHILIYIKGSNFLQTAVYTYIHTYIHTITYIHTNIHTCMHTVKHKQNKTKQNKYRDHFRKRSCPKFTFTKCEGDKNRIIKIPDRTRVLLRSWSNGQNWRCLAFSRDHASI